MSKPFIQFSNEQKKWLYIAYGLFAFSILVGGLTSVVGVILIYLKRSEMQDTVYANHCAFLIRTFWVSAIGLALGFALTAIYVGGIVLFIVPIWYILRVVYGFIKLHSDKSVTPTGWFI